MTRRAIKGGFNFEQRQSGEARKQRPLFVSASAGDGRDEHYHQAAFFMWLRLNEKEHPVLERFFAIPNGGHRAKSTAAKLKREGVKAGVLDTHLPVARNDFAGLWIEFKAGRNTLTAEQAQWKAFLESENHLVYLFRNWTDAARAVVSYLSLTSHTPIPSS